MFINLRPKKLFCFWFNGIGNKYKCSRRFLYNTTIVKIDLGSDQKIDFVYNDQKGFNLILEKTNESTTTLNNFLKKKSVWPL